MQEAAITEMVVDKLPEIARAVAEPLTKVDKITMYGEGNASRWWAILCKVSTKSQGAGFDIRQIASRSSWGQYDGQQTQRRRTTGH